MDDETHVRLVDTHTESDRRHDYVDLLHQELVLVVGSGLGVQSGMVWSGLYSIDVQQLRKLLDLFAAEAVYDA